MSNLVGVKSHLVLDGINSTGASLACELISPFLDYLKNKRIICPCCSFDSKIYLYLKNKGFDVHQSCGFIEDIDYCNFDVVVSNFMVCSTPSVIFKAFLKSCKLPFLVIGPASAVAGKFFDHSICGSVRRVRNLPSVSSYGVSCRFYSTFPSASSVFVKKQGREIVSDVAYDLSVFDYTSRADFVTACLLESGHRSYSRFFFGDCPSYKFELYKHVGRSGSFDECGKKDSKGSMLCAVKK